MRQEHQEAIDRLVQEHAGALAAAVAQAQGTGTTSDHALPERISALEAELVTAHTNHEAQVADFTRRLAAANDSIEALTAANLAAETRVHALEEHMATMQVQAHELRQQLQAASQVQQQELSILKAEHESTIASLEGQLAEVKTDSSHKLHQHIRAASSHQV